MIAGPYGMVAREALETASRSGGATTRVVTALTGPPQAGRALSTAVGQGAEALARTAGAGRQAFVADIPNALIMQLEQAGLAIRSTTMMNGVVATEIRFLPGAMEFILPFF